MKNTNKVLLFQIILLTLPSNIVKTTVRIYILL